MKNYWYVAVVAFLVGSATAFALSDLIFVPAARYQETLRWKAWLCHQPIGLAWGSNADSGKLVADTLCVRRDTSYRQPEPGVK